MQVPEFHMFLKLRNIGCALPNVTSRVLVVRLRLGMAEQHIFQCDVFLYPRTTGKTWRETELALRLQASSDLGSEWFAAKPHCLPLIFSGDIIRISICIPWMTLRGGVYRQTSLNQRLARLMH